MPDLIKKFSSTAVAFLILILVAGYFFVFEKGKPDIEEQKSALFPDIKKEEVISLKFNYPDSTIILSKEAQNWFLIKNNKRYKADSFTINSIIDNFVGLKVDGCEFRQTEHSCHRATLLEQLSSKASKVLVLIQPQTNNVLIGGHVGTTRNKL